MSKSNTEKSFRIAFLIGKHLRGQLTDMERLELESWLSTSEQNRQLFEDFSSDRTIEAQLEQFENTDTEAAWQRVQQRISAGGLRRVGQANWKGWWRSVAAVLVLSLAAWQVLYHIPRKPRQNVHLVSQYGEDVSPGTKRAELVLGNGTRITLENNSDSSFTENGSSVQRTASGSLIYSKGTVDKETVWNMIHIPKGGEYMVVLGDGTRVWLNAASSLRFPVQFTGQERRVELTEGEAFFEVAKNREKPFIVVTGQMEVQAIGTAFDVNTYPAADSSVSATLTEGRVKVTSKNSTKFLLPGEQVKSGKSTIDVFMADIEQVTAWKNGLFIFNGTPLPEVMEHLSRWYDVKIHYDKSFKDTKYFTGEIRRNVPVSKLLQIMELTGIAKFRIADNTIVILPYSP